MIKDIKEAIAWMNATEMEFISAETNTLWRLDPQTDDEIILLHSATTSGLECAELLKKYFTNLKQNNIKLREIPGINYELDEEGTALEKMAILLKELIISAQGNVTLAATGGFKAETMIMALVGNSLGVPICYIHEQFKTLIYLPYLLPDVTTQPIIRKADLPPSGRPRDQVINIQENKEHHRPKSWNKVAKMLLEIPWVDDVRFNKNAFSAPQNGVKKANRQTEDNRHVFWIHLSESKDTKIAVSVETTGHTQADLEQAATELRERLGRLL